MAMQKWSKMMIGKHVVVTTDSSRRGVFGGILESREGDVVVLTHARQCVYWSPKTKGAIGLSAIGPQDGSRVGPASPRLEIDRVSSISEMSKDAIRAWEAEPWS